jgi:hypothetical protein
LNGKNAQDVALHELREEFKSAVGTAFKLRVKGRSGERSLSVALGDQV